MDILTERLTNHIKIMEEIKAELKQVRDGHTEYRLASESTRVKLEHRVEELEKNKDLFGSRLFSLALCLLSAVLGGLITYTLKKP